MRLDGVRLNCCATTVSRLEQTGRSEAVIRRRGPKSRAFGADPWVAREHLPEPRGGPFRCLSGVRTLKTPGVRIAMV